MPGHAHAAIKAMEVRRQRLLAAKNDVEAKRSASSGRYSRAFLVKPKNSSSVRSYTVASLVIACFPSLSLFQ
ncbi:hypothetical protein ACOMHN_043412 [Nucella lapillus]